MIVSDFIDMDENRRKLLIARLRYAFQIAKNAPENAEFVMYGGRKVKKNDFLVSSPISFEEYYKLRSFVEYLLKTFEDGQKTEIWASWNALSLPDYSNGIRRSAQNQSCSVLQSSQFSNADRRRIQENIDKFKTLNSKMQDTICAQIRLSSPIRTDKQNPAQYQEEV
jgi:hypothetical protein